jgi:hypothetical protein
MPVVYFKVVLPLMDEQPVVRGGIIRQEKTHDVVMDLIVEHVRASMASAQDNASAKLVYIGAAAGDGDGYGVGTGAGLQLKASNSTTRL